MGGRSARNREAYRDGAAFVERRYVPVAGARVPILDWGFLRSDATYDVVHVRRGSFFRLEDHLDRFKRGMAKLRMSLPYDRAEIRAILARCVRLSGLRDAYAEVVCTRGVPPPGSPRPARLRQQPLRVRRAVRVDSHPEKQERGLNAVVSRVRCIPPDSLDPTVKNYHWLDLVAGLCDAYDRGGETVMLTDHADNVVEGPGFNVFAVKAGRICTPSRGVLEGITRRTVIELAGQLGIPLHPRAVPADELRAADEVSVTSTAGGIMPVTTLDGKPVGSGKPGPVTLQLREAYWMLHADPRYALPVRYD